MAMEVESSTKNKDDLPNQVKPKTMPSPQQRSSPLRKILVVASIAAGVQFGWALQLSLLTPYVQLLGIPHTWSSFVWLCGPISGLLVQPIVGYYSDRCNSRFGRRRPFIAGGATCVIFAVFLIGFAADLGHALGDSLGKKTKPRAVAFFVIGFWILDVANNMLQGPCRALMADLSGGDHSKMRSANAAFSFFMGVGNVLGYAAGSYTKLYHIFSFTKSQACDVYCANLKSCFVIDIVLLLVLTATALTLVKEKTLEEIRSEGADDEGGEEVEIVKTPFLGEVVGAFRGLKRPMWILLLVTALNWVAWFPFLLFDTDWMGREVYGGKVGDGGLYDEGVRAGSLGLMFNSIVLGFMSVGIEFMSRILGGPKRLWGIVNFLLAVFLSLTVLITKLAHSTRRFDPAGKLLPPPLGVKAGALSIFAALGIPQAATYSIPFALASIFCDTSGAGQGLSLGMFVSVISGPWDALFGGGNLPAFVLGAVAAFASGIFAIFVLPSPPVDQVNSKMARSASIAFH
ncbi:hypothetical protein FEM48_Zijuj06G0170900 [Ziziphus jujuba var. spinosa]|uniref:Uncharacterized protein n=1 Tax=Ziziphus jujuba var. spinosa TaxID=714518 RepID=A0A978VAI9_ZIZJJ|nr:hypothetical protein FEM48_Zijuj06G0170900 [Ziziphus jujuba var. spinosa]